MAGPQIAMRHRTVLPPNASLLERVVDGNLPTGWGSMAAQAEPDAKPEALQPWVAQHWQLSQFDVYFPSTQALIDAGLPWLRERGSAAAVKRAMGWLGYTSVKIEEDGPRLHINPGNEVSLADIRRIAHVVRASIPLHVRFYRLFYRYDRRRLKTNAHPGLNNGLLGRDSGVDIDLEGDGLLASQGQFFGAVAERPANAGLQAQEITGWAHVTRRTDVLRTNCRPGLNNTVRRSLGHMPGIVWPVLAPAYQRLPSAYDKGSGMATAVPARNAPPQLRATDGYSVAVPRTNASRTWEGTWDARPWQESEITTQYTEEPTQ